MVKLILSLLSLKPLSAKAEHLICAVPQKDLEMPIKLPASLPAYDILTREGVMVMDDELAASQDIRPLADRSAEFDAKKDSDGNSIRAADWRNALADRIQLDPHVRTPGAQYRIRTYGELLPPLPRGKGREI